jgi:hypothetical protein
MNCTTRHSSSLLLSLALGLVAKSATAQGPRNPPPWWGVQDEVTVSLSFDFNTQFSGLPLPTPSFAVTAPWYNNPAPWSGSNNFTWLPTLSGHTGVCALVGTGAPAQAELKLFVDNDPHLDWIKIFWFQFDAFKGPSGEISQTIKEELQKYGRATVTEKSENLGFGWERITVSAELIPQPDDEEIDFSFFESLGGTVAIDNLHVSSKCVKPRPDERGEPIGKVMNVGNLTASTGRNCRGLAVTSSSALGANRYWVATAGTGATPHAVLEVNSFGVPTGTITQLPTTIALSPLGPMDMAVERRVLTSGTLQERIYVLEDLRQTVGVLRISALDATAGGTPTPALDVNIPVSPFTQGQNLSLAFDPTGVGPGATGVPGVGTFWIGGRVTGGNWRAVEFDRAGVPTGSAGAGGVFAIPAETTGMAYDETLGNFYCFSANTVISPSGTPIQSNGVEISGYTGEPTGVRFCGDLTLQAAGVPPGGVASAMTMYRSSNGINSEIRFACVVNVGAEQYFYELAGPYRYGYSRYGTCGMQNGPPFLGGSFDVTLSGVPNSLFGVLFIGNASANIPLGPGIQSEAVASLIPTVSSSPLPVIPPGDFSISITLPNSPALSYSEAYFQWALLDTTAPGFLGFSQAGKTMIYP